MVDYTEMSRSLHTLLTRARGGQFPVGLCSCISPIVTEIAALGGFGYILINQEHTIIDSQSDLAEHVRAAHITGLPIFVKLNEWDPLAARNAMDLGICGVQVPFINTAERLREAQASIRFPPYGNRGLCLVPRATHYGLQNRAAVEQASRFIDFSNRTAIVIPMIESVEALENLDEILAVPDVPIIALGPLDLGLSLGIGEQALNGDEEAANELGRVLRDVAARAHAAGKLVMAPAAIAAHEEEVMVANRNNLPYVLDTQALSHGMKEIVRISELAKAKLEMASAASSRTDVKGGGQAPAEEEAIGCSALMRA